MDFPWWADVWEAAKVASPFATLFATWQWYLQYRERRELSATNMALMREIIDVTHGATDAIEELNRLLQSRTRR